MKPWYSTKKAASLMGKTEETVRRMCAKGLILCYKAVFKSYANEKFVFVIPQKEFDEAFLKKDEK